MTAPRNEAAERLRRVLIDFDYERHVTTLQDALAEERSRVIAEIRERLEHWNGPPLSVQPDLAAILDDVERAR